MCEVKCVKCEGTGTEEGICGHCNGSGEGRYDGSRCMMCGGLGEYGGECPECEGTGKRECGELIDELRTSVELRDVLITKLNTKIHAIERAMLRVSAERSHD